MAHFDTDIYAAERPGYLGAAPSEVPRGGGISGPAEEAIRQMQEEETAQRME